MVNLKGSVLVCSGFIMDGVQVYITHSEVVRPLIVPILQDGVPIWCPQQTEMELETS